MQKTILQKIGKSLFKCSEKNKLTGTCNVCGCVFKAKVKVIEEYCPMNKWKDIKEFKDRGLAVKLHDTDKTTLILWMIS